MMMRWIAVILVAAALSGCAPESQPQPDSSSSRRDPSFPNWPPLLNEFRFHWTAAPGIDLTTGPAVVMRAYIESYEIANMTFDITNLYPGFLRATPENQPNSGNYSAELIGIRPLWAYTNSEPPIGVQHFGFNTDHLLEITTTERGYRATICTGSYSNFIKSSIHPDVFVSVSSRETENGAIPDPYSAMAGISVRQVEFTQEDPRIPAGGPSPVEGTQSGPAPAPQADVFGNWFITGSSGSGWGPVTRPVLNNFPTPDVLQRCSQAMPDNESQRRKIMTGYKDQPPSHDNAVPGWPLKVE